MSCHWLNILPNDNTDEIEGVVFMTIFGKFFKIFFVCFMLFVGYKISHNETSPSVVRRILNILTLHIK